MGQWIQRYDLDGIGVADAGLVDIDGSTVTAITDGTAILAVDGEHVGERHELSEPLAGFLRTRPKALAAHLVWTDLVRQLVLVEASGGGGRLCRVQGVTVYADKLLRLLLHPLAPKSAVSIGRSDTAEGEDTALVVAGRGWRGFLMGVRLDADDEIPEEIAGADATLAALRKGEE